MNSKLVVAVRVGSCLALNSGVLPYWRANEPPGLLAYELTDGALDKGCDVSFTARDAAACSSIVPSLTIVIVEAV